MGVNRIRIITAVHGRHDTLKAYCWQIAYLREATGLELPLTISYTLEEDQQVIKEELENVDFVQIANSPLSEKHNALLTAADKHKDWDCLLLLGSDNLVSEQYINSISLLKLEHAVYGVNNIYFLNRAQKKLKQHSYLGHKVLGAGRVYPREVIESIKGKKHLFSRPWYGIAIGEDQYLAPAFEQLAIERKFAEPYSRSHKRAILWAGRKDSGLDNESNRLLRASGIDLINIEETLEGGHIVDIKTRDNITPWERIGGQELPLDEARAVLERISPEIDLLWNQSSLNSPSFTTI